MTERIRLMDDREAEQVVGGAYTGSVFVYTVQEGESLSVLAHRFGTSVSVIAELNEINTDLWRRGIRMPPTALKTVGGSFQSDQPTRFKTRVRTTKASANHFVALASLASRVLAFPLDKNVSAPPEMAPESPALFPLCIRTITVRARPAIN